MAYTNYNQFEQERMKPGLKMNNICVIHEGKASPSQADRVPNVMGYNKLESDYHKKP